jgi:hypothetical protein
MPRYVILRHEGSATYQPGVHWDLMLELGGALRTWALAEPPSAAGPIPARPLPDHRLAYLNYEGPIAGGRGRVTRWDVGEFDLLSDTPEGLALALVGNRLRGRAVLSLGGEEDGKWTFVFSPAGPS